MFKQNYIWQKKNLVVLCVSLVFLVVKKLTTEVAKEAQSSQRPNNIFPIFGKFNL